MLMTELNALKAELQLCLHFSVTSMMLNGHIFKKCKTEWVYGLDSGDQTVFCFMVINQISKLYTSPVPSKTEL